MLKLTINDRILLHLLDHLASKTRREAPYAITQKGIADHIGIRWNHVPRAMMKLKVMGYVLEEICHIEDKGRRQKAYFLTDDGMLHARNLREKVMEQEIHLIKPDGQVVDVRLSDVNSILKSKLSSLFIYSNLTDDGHFDAGRLRLNGEKEAKETTDKIFLVKGGISWPDEFIGRDAEIRTLKELLDSKEFNTVVIYGSIGVGKSALLAHVIRDYRSKRDILWVRMSENDMLVDILRHLSEFQSQLGNTGLAKYLGEHEAIDSIETQRLMEKGLNDHPVILVFDNYFKVSEDVKDFFSELCNHASKTSFLKLLVGSRDTTPFYCRFYHGREVKNKKIAEMTIKGLDKEGIKRMLNAPNIEDEALKKIHLMTRGHPLTIELVKNGDVNSLKRIKGFSRQEASLLLYLKTVEK